MRGVTKKYSSQCPKSAVGGPDFSNSFEDI
jgi:hypothetical protein